MAKKAKAQKSEETIVAEAPVKEIIQQEPVASKIQYSEEVEEFLVLPQETILRK